MEYLLLLLLLLLLHLSSLALPVMENRTTIYAFGDTIFDAGNNNRLPTVCRADHPPLRLRRLHKKGAKRMGVLGMPPLGCLPMDITAANLNNSRNSSFKRECVAQHNSDAQEYNTNLQTLIKILLIDLPHSKIAYVDIYNPMMDMINNPNKFGFEHTLEGCCGTGSVELGPLCSKYAATCPDPSQYLFWDAAHPTYAAYQIFTKIFKEKVLSS